MNITMNDLDWKAILIKKYKEYKLTEVETMLLFLSDAILSIDPTTFLSPELLSSYMTVSKDEIDLALTKLMSKGFIDTTFEGGSMKYRVDSFKKRVFEDLVRDFSLRREKERMESSSNLYTDIEQMTGTILSPIEKDRITNWLRNGASEGMIKEAIESSMTANGNINFSKADKKVLEMLRGESRRELGSSAIDEDTSSNEKIREYLSSHSIWDDGSGK